MTTRRTPRPDEDTLPGVDEQLLALDEDEALARWLADRACLPLDVARDELEGLTS
ncbi:MAG: hypothetical protein L0H84_21700 [Pseudonocardia sp.]|nr:hypothetical protein [Pseudonocardia sp.]